MDILILAQQLVPELKKKSNSEWVGPCPICPGGEDRFMVWPSREAWYCRICDKGGDALSLLRGAEGLSCPDAHIQLGLECQSHNCAVAEKCRLGRGVPVAKQEKQSLLPPEEKQQPEFSPGEAQAPEQIWMTQAASLVEKAHAALLDCPEQIDYLTARGIPIEAIKKGQLGWLPADRFPAREAWGLPTVYKENNKPKKLLIPAGILIPFFDVDGNPHRIRIRRSSPPKPDEKYYWLKGSGNDVPVIGGNDRRGVVVVESDLDAFMVRWQCRYLDVSVIPLGTCCAKPKGWAMQALEQALAILVAHDFEPRTNEKTGKPENPGGQGARWWLQQFQRAKRWPVPAGKDPGEYYQDHGGDIRKWVLDGLPPIFHVKYQPPKPKAIPEHAKGETLSGHGYVVAYAAEHVQQLAELYPEHVVFSPEEMAALKGMNKKEAELMLLAKKVMDDGPIEGTYPIDETYMEQLVGKEQSESLRAGAPVDALPLPVEPEPVQEILL